MADIIAEGVVKVGVDDNTSAELARIQAEYEAAMRNLSREEATLKIKGDIGDLKAKVDEAKAKLRELEAQEKAEAARNEQLSAQQKSASTRRLADIRKEIEATKEQVRTDETRSKALQGQLQLTQQQQREEALAEKARQASAKAASDREKVRAQSDAAAIKAQRDLTNSRISDLASQREAINLQQRFIAAQKEADALSKQIGRTKPGETRQTITLDRAKVVLEMEEIKARLAAMGRDPVKQEVKLDTNAATRAWNLWTKGTLSGNETKTTLDDLGKQLGKLFSTRLNIGPITASIGGMIAALGSLAPIIGGLIGAFSSLVSVAGAGLVGALGLGGAAMSGFGLAAVGALTAFHPIISQLEVAHAAMQKYQKAVQTYGEHSKQAQQAQKQLNNTLAALPVPVQQAVKGFQTLSNAYEKATHPQAMRTFSQVTSSALKTLSADMGFFARDTNHAMAAAGQGFASWMAALRSSAARHILDNIFQNFNRSIPSIMSGLSSIGAALGRWFSTMSNYLPGLSRDFAVWAAHVDEAAKRTNGWASGSAKLVDAFKSIISFVGAAGRVIISFFKAGVEPGVGWVDQMTGSLNKLADSMNTVAGQQKLQNFFTQSISVTKEVFNALQPLFAVFVHLAALFAPLANAMLPIIQFFGQLAASVTGALGPLGKVIVDVAAFIAVGRLLGRLNPLLGIFSLLRGGFASVSTAAKGAAEAIKAFAASEGIINRVKAAWSAWTSRGTAAAAPAAASGAAEFSTAIEGASTAGATEIGTALETAGTTAAAEMGTAIETAGTAAAAEMAAAVQGAGAASAAENAAARTVGTVAPAVSGAGAAAEIEGSLSAGGGAAAAEISGGMEAAGAAAAAEIAAAMETAGAASAVTRGAGAAIGAGEAAAATAAETAVAGEAAAATTAGTATAGLGAALAGIAAPAAIAVLGIGALVIAAGNMDRSITSSDAALKESANAANRTSDAYKTGAGAALDYFHAQSDLHNVGQESASVNKQVASTQASLNKLSDQGKTNTQAYKDKIVQLNAELDHQHSLDVTRAQDQQKLITAAKTEQTTYGTNLKNAYRAAASSALALATARQFGDKVDVAKAEYANAQALRNVYVAQNGVILGNYNMQRAQAGLYPLIGATTKQTEQYASQLRSLMDLTSQSPKAQSFLIHLPNPKDLLAIQSAISKLNNQGDVTKSVNILANAKNATDALNKINGLQLHEKTITLKTNLGDTVIQLAKVQGIKLTPKQLNILHHGDTEAILAVAKVAGVKIDPKIMRIFGDIQDAIKKGDTVRAIKDINKILRFLGDPSGAVNAAGTVKRTLGGVPGERLTRFLGNGANLNAVASGAIRAVGGVPRDHLTGFLGNNNAVKGASAGATAAINAVPGTHNTNLSAAGNAASMAAQASAALGAIPTSVNSTVTVTFNAAGAVSIGAKLGYLAEGGSIPPTSIAHFADGGQSSDSKKISSQVKSLFGNMLNSVFRGRRTTGEKVGSPTFLVGEEYRPEFVIATNPAYREQNKELLTEAAKALGMQVFAPGGVTHSRKHHPPGKKPPAGSTVSLLRNYLAPADRIGGVGTQDIQDEINTLQNQYNALVTLAGKTDKKGHRIPLSSANKHLMTKLGNQINALKGFLHTANTGITQFNTIENLITTYQNLMTAAENSPTGLSGPDPGNQHNFDYWKGQRQAELAEHSRRLRVAFHNAQAFVAKHPGSAQFGYVEALYNSLSQSVSDEIANKNVQPSPQAAITADSYIKSLGIDSAVGIKYADELAAEQYATSIQQGKSDADTPGTTQYSTDRAALLADTQAIMNTYRRILTTAQNDPTVATNYSVLKDLSDAFNSAQTNYLSLKSSVEAVGPTQVQLSDTARGNLYKSFASNIAPAILGGQAAAAQFTPQNPAMLPSAPSIASEPHGSTTTVNVTNHYQTQPEDPHAWSQGLAWELGAAL